MTAVAALHPNARPSPWALAIRRVLDDGAWHDREKLIRVGAAVVPPGIAHRENERRRRQRRVHPGPRDEVRRQADPVDSGARRKAVNALHKLVSLGHVERDGDRYRLAAR